MKKIIVAICASGFLAGCATPYAPGESRYESRTISIAAVEKVLVSGAIKATVSGQADSAEVTLHGPPEMLADAVAQIEEDTLVIRFEEGTDWSWNPGAGVQAQILLPTVTDVAVKGPARLEVLRAVADTFSAGTGGSGSITIRGLEANNVQLGVGGSGSITASGTATQAQMGIGGSGSIEAKRLRVKTAQIGIGGSGSVYADVSESAEIGVGGSGRVEVVGGAKCEIAERQADQIECR